MRCRIWLLLLILLIPLSTLWAQEDELDLDSLFEEDMIEDIDEEDQDENPQDELLKNEKGIQWGGNFSGTVGINFDWDNYFAHGAEVSDSALTPQLDTSLFFDARPVTDFRVFGKFRIQGGGNFNFAGLGIDPNSISLEPQDDGSFSVTIDDSENDDSDGQPVQLNFGVEELFTDFQWKDYLYFRFGKSFVSWGVGYFWSPADFINLDSINVEDPTAGRTGPVHFKIHFPFKSHNAYLYVVTNEITKPEYVIVAPKVEFVIKNTEIGTGFYFQYESAPRMMLTVSTSLWKFKIFGEGVLSWGSDRIFVRPSRIQPEPNEDGSLPYHAMDTYTLKNQLFFNGTAGLMFLDSDAGIIIAGQYFFNGEGYSHHFFNDGTSWLDAAAHLLQNPQDNGLAMPQGQQPDGYDDPPGLAAQDLLNWGQHYLGLSFIWNEIGDSPVSAGVFWIVNMTDGSGIVYPNISFSFTDYIKLSTGVRMTHGWPGGEYTDTAALFLQNPDRNTQEPVFSLNFEISFGGGAF